MGAIAFFSLNSLRDLHSETGPQPVPSQQQSNRQTDEAFFQVLYRAEDASNANHNGQLQISTTRRMKDVIGDVA